MVKNGTLVQQLSGADGTIGNLHIHNNKMNTEWHAVVLKKHVMPSSQHLFSRKAVLISANCLMCALKQHCSVEKKFSW